jgi:hypothetical protein
MDRQGGIVVEPWLDRVWDFSVQFEMDSAGLRRLEMIRLENNPRGQFRAVAAGPRVTRGLPVDLARFLHATVFPLYDGVFREFLEERLRQAGFLGAAGVDALVYRDGGGELRCKPLVELNPRYTMGRIAHEIRRQVAPGSSIRLEMVQGAEAGPAPEVRLDPETGRMESGRIVLSRGAGFGAVLRVGRILEELIIPDI